MTAPFLVAATGLILCTVGHAQGLATKQALLVTNTPPPLKMLLRSQPGKVQAPLAGGITVTNEQAQPVILKNFTTRPLTPGVYRTTPFACIVVVPDQHADDNMAVWPANNVAPLPIVKPELHLVPLDPK